MLTRTSELACRTLLFLGLNEFDRAQPLSPRRIAESLDCSPSYLAKTAGKLVRAGLLQSVKGAHGGVLLARRPEDITLLSIFEACQGLLIANYCQHLSGNLEECCSFHRAMLELHSVTINTLSKWTLQDMMDSPISSNPFPGTGPPCKMTFRGCEQLISRQEATGPSPTSPNRGTDKNVSSG